MTMISLTKSWLQQNNILARDDWLQACVEWIQEENQGTNLTQGQINDMVYEQWLLTDLHELETQCLPEDLLTASKYMLRGSFALQVDSVIDVGQSYYSQLQKRKGTENANVLVTAEDPTYKPWEAKPSRMLMLKLTDGKQTVQGMEYRPISCLNVDLAPGTKMLIQGEVLCRHAVLMLTESNVRLLGGEVDTLMEANTAIKVLQEAMDSSTEHAGKTYRQDFQGTEIKSKIVSSASQMQAPQSRSMTRPLFKSEPQSQQTGTTVVNNQSDLLDKKDNVIIPARPRVQTSTAEEQWDDDQNYAEYYDAFLDEMDNNDFNEPVPNTITVRGDSATSGNSRLINTVKKETKNVDRGPNNRTVHSSSLGQRSSGESVKRNSRLKLSNTAKKTPAKRPDRNFAVKNCDMDFDDADDFDFDDDFDYSAVDNIPQAKLPDGDNQQKQQRSNQMKAQNALAGQIGNMMCNQSTADTRNSGMVPVAQKLVKSTANVMGTSSNHGRSAVVSTMTGLVQKGSNSDRKSNNCGVIPDTYVLSATAVKRSRPVSDGEDDNDVLHAKQSRLSSESTEPEPVRSNLQLKVSSTREGASHCRSDTSLCQDANNECPFTYLSHILGNKDASQSRIHTVKAYISTLMGKLTIVNNGWALSAKVNDGTAAVDVDLSSGVLNQLIGFSAQDAQVMKTQAKKDSSVRELLTNGIQQCQQKLIDLVSLMEVQVTPTQSKPVVVSISSVTANHVELLYNRVISALRK